MGLINTFRFYSLAQPLEIEFFQHASMGDVQNKLGGSALSSFQDTPATGQH